jgi:hypothetical protein
MTWHDGIHPGMTSTIVAQVRTRNAKWRERFNSTAFRHYPGDEIGPHESGRTSFQRFYFDEENPDPGVGSPGFHRTKIVQGPR